MHSIWVPLPFSGGDWIPREGNKQSQKTLASKPQAHPDISLVSFPQQQNDDRPGKEKFHGIDHVLPADVCCEKC